MPGTLRAAAAGPLALAVLASPLGTPAASADQCPSVQVLFARGTNEPPGLGFAGQAFADSLVAQLPGKTIAVSAINYPATDDYLRSATAGSEDARAQIASTVGGCPATKLVLGGYSQGASVIEMATSALPAAVADHVAAVALFGNPTSDLSKMLAGGAPLPALSPPYAAKTLDLCMADDPICSPGANMMAHVAYVPSGMTAQAATFAAQKVDPVTG